VDGFNQDERADESDQCGVILLRLLAPERKSLEPLELSDGLLDPSTTFIEQSREELRLVQCGLSVWDHRADPALSCCGAVGAGVVSLVAHNGTRLNVGTDVEEDVELPTIAGLAASQMERDWQTVEIGLEVDFGGKAASRAAERLAVLPPFAPAAETCARTTVESSICTR
jgi:hypothetical protein